ncbi:fimbrial biogenesis outer membrane usher protein [Leclercia adecarboxylata]|uniref:fimbria/pilus outer membrane usher protein n=1 Tax=Leclercia adecarboxylata TaxID=83655 RepID=UPI00202A4933|nr:fimbria/pilus outer membrane usher protein [Leclercia adecarboxylata]URN97856.1 fimbrial biogenesis outer membrane usher protein [Leclercia adecarboxylata]
MCKTLYSLFKPSRLACFIALALPGITQNVCAEEYFNPALLEVDNPSMKGVDLSSFASGAQVPGRYRVEVVLNDQTVDTREIEFKAATTAQGDRILQPCLSLGLLQSYGVKTDLFPALDKESECVNFTVIPEASADFIFGAQKLLLSFPQAALTSQARGYVAPELWDEGINALMLNYSISGDNTWGRNSATNNSQSQYANLRPGINIGPWRLRNYITWRRDNDGKTQWDSVYTYAQRNIVPLKSQLTLGDSSSPSDVFDSIPFRGGQLASDDEMLPDSQKGYAPVVRGIARSSAQVIIRQNGYIIYQSYVAPGAFEITDMYPTGGAGDLNVTVKEADGSEHEFVVPYASVPVLQREGRLKYSLTGGQYRPSDSQVEKRPLMQGTAIYGLPKGFTIYGGVQAASPYQSYAVGIGRNMGGIGAVSADVTQAWSSPENMSKSSGRAWRLRYSKNFTDTGTNFTATSYRYSTAGYYGMQEVLDASSDNASLQDRRRNRAEVTLSQTLGPAFGSITGSAIREDYWNADKTMSSYSVSYNNAWNGITWGLSYTYSNNASAGSSGSGKTYDKDQILALNVSIPLDRFLSNTWASYSLNTSKKGNTTHSLGLSGTALQENALSWGIQQGYGNDGVGHSSNFSADYHGTYGEILGGYSTDENMQRMNYGLNGGILVHANGVTLGQPFGETIALIKAPGASGVGVTGQTGVKTDFRGYTVATNVSPYRKNRLSLDTQTLPDDVELQLTTQTVIPTRGAVVRAEYIANVGNRVLMTLAKASGQPVPFGATVTVATDKNSAGFIVGDQGQVYLTGLENSGELIARWGREANEQCRVNYALHIPEANSGVVLSNEICK